MQTMAERIKSAIQTAGLSYGELSKLTGIPKAALQRYATGETSKVPIDRIEGIALHTGVSAGYLLGWEASPLSVEKVSAKKEIAPVEEPNAIFLDQQNVYMVPLYETVSAGLGAYAINNAVDHIPLYITTRSEAQETMCLRVCGDSMYPKIEEGDIIQVHKQPSVDSGTLAVVLLDGEEGLVKRIEYGPNWIELHSINPMYKTMRFEGPEVLRIQIVGVVKKIIKNV